MKTLVLVLCSFLLLSNSLALGNDINEEFKVSPYLESWWPWVDEEEPISETPNPFRSENLIGLKTKLKQRIIGQDRAIDATVAALERYVYGLNNSQGPIASLFYVGPTGVGKTQLAKELAKEILGSEKRLIRLNMAEYSDKESIFQLIGPPAGYREYEKGGVLTNALKKSPYAIVLLDEIEKASPEVIKIFLQILDEGFIIDRKNNLIDCRQMLFILTSNIEGDKILTLHDLGRTDQEILRATQAAMTRKLSSEFYNRLQPVIFRGFKDGIIDDLIQNILQQETEELISTKNIGAFFDANVTQFLKEHFTNYHLGARPLKKFIQQSILTSIAEAIKENYIQKNDLISVSIQDNDCIIQNLTKEIPFIWQLKDEQVALKPPFNFKDLLNLEDKLQKMVLGQPFAIKMSVAALLRYAAGICNEGSPIGALLYVGPTGVGKTQLAKELAKELMGSEQKLIRFDMSEYSEASHVSKLMGSPPGYLNHEEGGRLTNALKQNPFAIVLLDEIEKAHLSVLKLFLQIFDEGKFTDNKGYSIDCRNVLFIATTNLSSSKILSMHQKGFNEDDILEAIRGDIIKFISPELFNRLETALFLGLTSESLDQLVYKLLEEVKEELQVKKQIVIQFDASLIEFLKVRGFDYELGARPLKRLIQQTVVTTIAKEIIAGNVSQGDTIKIYYKNEGVLILK